MFHRCHYSQHVHARAVDTGNHRNASVTLFQTETTLFLIYTVRGQSKQTTQYKLGILVVSKDEVNKTNVWLMNQPNHWVRCETFEQTTEIT